MDNLPEAGGVAYADLYTEDGTKICLTSRALTPAMAYINLIAAIEETGALTKRPAGNAQPQPSTPTDDEWEASADPDFHPTADQQTQPRAGKDWGMISYPPKAAELKAGDVYEVMVNEYKAVAKEIAFWQKGGQYPILTHKMTNDFAIEKFQKLFKGWQPTEDGEHHPLTPMILTVVGSDKTNKNDNHYHNLEAVRKQ